MNTDLRQFQKAQKQTHEQAPNLVLGQFQKTAFSLMATRW